MTVSNELGEKAPEPYVELLELIDQKTEHEDNALVEINDDGLMEVFRLHVYHIRGSYQNDEFDNIIDHIEHIIEQEEFPEVEVYEVDSEGISYSLQGEPDNTNTYHQVTFNGYGYE